MTNLFTETSSPGLVKHIADLGSNLTGCEIGVCRGYNIKHLLDCVPQVIKIYAIDPWKIHNELQVDFSRQVSQDEVNEWKNIALAVLQPLGDRVVILEKTAKEAQSDIPDSSLDFIFIDGDHSYDAVLDDCMTYWSKVRSSGIFSGHDWNFGTVQSAVYDFRKQNNITTEIQFTDNNVWFWYK
jgi:predicted O-methyltransferase YrrM